jgi:hypothetical protein
MDYDLQKLHTAITGQGYVSLNADPFESVERAMQELALCLGGAMLPGRNGKIRETLETIDAHEAHRHSLSRFSGAGAQPWHVDGSHLTVPPRYVILGCHRNAGAGAPPTQLMRVKDAGFPLPESRYETFIVRNGRSSFYSTIASTDRPWIRFDPGCMSSRTAQGRTMLEALESLPAQPCLNLEWAVGEILVFDNWAVLHRRGSASGPGHRALLRISLKE